MWHPELPEHADDRFSRHRLGAQGRRYQRSEIHRTNEGWSRRLLAEALLIQGHGEEAHAEANAAVACIEQAPQFRSTLEPLASALEVLARTLEALGRCDAALDAVNRAATVLEPEYAKRPKALERVMQKVRETQARLASNTGTASPS